LSWIEGPAALRWRFGRCERALIRGESRAANRRCDPPNIDIGRRKAYVSNVKARTVATVAGGVAGPEIMTLSFPNESRCFDGTRRAVRFWGHDSAMEATFFATEAALRCVQPDLRLDEAGMLRAFDANRDRIRAAAVKVYARGRKGSYDVERADF
jgi:hypothetical protein